MLSIIHHFENMFDVPYRFEKNFNINCEFKNNIKTENFSLDVLKNQLPNNLRTKNKKIFDNFESKKKLKQTVLGKGSIYCFDLNEFSFVTKKLFEEDINCWFK